MKITTLGKVLEDIALFSWKEWVFLERDEDIGPTTKCLVIHADEAELGSDGFTPAEAENRNMVEFLSIHDLQGVLRNLSYVAPDASIGTKCAAAVYFFDKDAYLPPTTFPDEGH